MLQHPLANIILRRNKRFVNELNGVLTAKDTAQLLASRSPERIELTTKDQISDFRSKKTYQAAATRASSSRTISSFLCPDTMPLLIATWHSLILRAREKLACLSTSLPRQSL